MIRAGTREPVAPTFSPAQVAVWRDVAASLAVTEDEEMAA